MNNNSIGIYDSGVGGLTVLSEIIKVLPNENIIYLGDTARMPYGTKSKETIIEFTNECVNFLVSKNVKAIIIACGTISSQALEEVKDKYNIPIIGIIEPTVEYLNADNKTIGVIATKGTINSNAWEKAIKDKYNNVKIINKSCQLLVGLAEEGFLNNDVARLTIKEYMKDFKDVDKLILGCTHFPLFKNLIQEELPGVEIVDTGKEIIKHIQIEKGFDMLGKHEFYLTDVSKSFKETAKMLLNYDVNINKIEI